MRFAILTLGTDWRKHLIIENKVMRVTIGRQKTEIPLVGLTIRDLAERLDSLFQEVLVTEPHGILPASLLHDREIQFVDRGRQILYAELVEHPENEGDPTPVSIYRVIDPEDREEDVLQMAEFHL